MTAAVTELLAQLVEVTAPPPDGADPEAVLAAFDAMIATRATLLHALEAATPRAPTAAGLNLADSLLASLDYFDGIRTLALTSPAGKKCDLLLTTHGAPGAGSWQKVWEGGRPGDRRDNEKLQLYRRQAKTTANRQAGGAQQ